MESGRLRKTHLRPGTIFWPRRSHPMAVGLIHRRGRRDPQRMHSRPGMGIQMLSRQSPNRRWLLNRFPSHRRFGGGFPSISPVTAVLAVASQLFPRSPPFRRWLPKYFPGHCRFGSRLPSVSPVIAVLAVASQVFHRSLPFWRLLPNRFPGHRRFGSRFRNVSPAAATQEGKKLARENLPLMLFLSLHIPQELPANASSPLASRAADTINAVQGSQPVRPQKTVDESDSPTIKCD